jgi:hypothetical protein
VVNSRSVDSIRGSARGSAKQEKRNSREGHRADAAECEGRTTVDAEKIEESLHGRLLIDPLLARSAPDG